jgi:PKD repeat protein
MSVLLMFFSASVFESTTIQKSANNFTGTSAKTAEQKIKSGAPRIIMNYGLLPLYFIKNAGQKDSNVRYYAQTKKYTLWITDDALVFDSALAPQEDGTTPERDVSRLNFPGANKGIEIQPERITDYKVNYISGNDPSAWLTDLQTSESIIYKNIFDNIDIRIYGRESRIEYDWIIKSGGNTDKIRFKYSGVTKISLSPIGDLIVTTRFGEILHKKPEAWQMIDGEKIPVRAEFIKIEGNTYGFKVSAYDEKHELVIDPLVIPYSTYLGGTDVDYGYAIAVDSQGSAYITGYSNSFNFPVQNAYQWWRTGNDAFVTKFSASGTSLIYSTYIGGAGTDRANGIALDSSNSAYITGYTTSNNFPMVNAYDNSFSASNDVFVTKLSPAGNSLVYSTYIGDTLSDIGNGIAVDSLNRAYITGTTTSTTFPTASAYDASHNGGTDAFVLRLAEAGNVLEYSTFLGTASTDEGYSVAVDSSFSAYVTGRTNGTGFPTLNPFQAARSGGYDAFITKLSALGDALVYSTYLGGTGNEECRGITVDTAGNAYVIGNTLSTNFPTLNPLQAARAGNTDLFITKMSAAGNTRVFSTYFGGTGDDYARGIAIDSTNSIYITGYTTSTNFPTFQATQSAHAGGTNDAFITNISNTGGSLLYSTYLGGTLSDISWAIAVSSEPAAYICGYTLSTDFPLNNAYDTTLGGTTDVFCTKYLWYISNIPPVAVVSANPTMGQLPLTVNFDGSGSSDSDGTIISYSWDFGDGSTGSGMSVSHEYTQQGTYTATLTVMDNRNDTATDTVQIQVSGNIPPVVDLSASTTAGIAPLTVDFDGSRSHDPDGSIVSYRWNFGDGSHFSQSRATHIYPKAGKYYASLTVEDNSGLSSSEFVTINVYNLQAVSCIMDTYGISKIKANNKAETWIGVYLIDSLSGAPAIILPRIDVRLEASSGNFLESLSFESNKALYSQRISSGAPGLATITAYISGVPKCSASLEYIWPKPPAQVQLKLFENRSLFTFEYSGLLTWQPNPYEVFPPSGYWIYRSIGDSPFELIGQVDSMVFQLEEQHLSKSIKYSYSISTVDIEGDESEQSPVVSSK